MLEKNPKITSRNKQLIIETLRQVAELMIWGDQNNDNFFFFLAEKNLLGHFLGYVEQKFDRSITVQVMQTLSIMIQVAPFSFSLSPTPFVFAMKHTKNISKQVSLYYLFSNNYINDLIVHDFDFTDSEILAYYVSFLKTISLKLDRDVINFFFNAKAHGLFICVLCVRCVGEGGGACDLCPPRNSTAQKKGARQGTFHFHPLCLFPTRA